MHAVRRGEAERRGGKRQAGIVDSSTAVNPLQNLAVTGQVDGAVVWAELYRHGGLGCITLVRYFGSGFTF
jgi:hypothetical protein